MKVVLLAATALSLSFSAANAAQNPPPQPLPMTPPITAAQDVPYPGTLKLFVDATDTDRRIIRVKQSIPVDKAGPFTLLYPEWLPGNHAPRGPVDKVAGLVITAGGQRIAWTRDPVEVYAYHVDVPQGATSLEVEFQFVSPVTTDQGRIVVTNEMMNLQWNQLALYPAGWFTRQIPVELSLRLPDQWKFGVAMDVAGTADGVTTFKPVSFETLVDSPMFAGRYYRQFDLDPGGRSPVKLNVVADREELLAATPEQIEKHRNLVKQADKLYGTRQYDRYDFLLSLTDRMGGIGLEHHRSSENGVPPTYFTDWDKHAANRDLLPHEYTHSWNGKFRRGADLFTPDFSVPMRNSMLWVYEGQTQYWGYVLSARSGLLTKQETLEAIASTAATYEARVGRTWRTVLDTTNDPITIARKAEPWTSFQRGEDYYSEGQLVWLDADTLIREKTGGKKSLDDFAKVFLGAEGKFDGSYTPLTYGFDDVVEALNKVVAHDWAGFLKARIYDVAPKAPLDGLARGGYRLVYKDTPTAYFKANESRRKTTDLTYSLGVVVGGEGKLSAVQWEGPAFKAGLTNAGQIIAVNGLAYDAERLKTAITEAKGGAKPIELLVKTAERYRTVQIPYHDGLRYPALERIAGTPARLDDILAPRK
ncbi:peptidase M61 [Caulobacter segnis]|uniref:M61 family metallopeptidase n=1 Tax=Caulobacter segnis TaxID=88688 RepID=UPI00241054DA|nr:peptidase M61 [Caulobacter segnis]MDG2519913.1 peptidase M61 [Caulobacter segnis]